MTVTPTETQFAPGGRSSPAEIRRDYALLAGDGLLLRLIDAMPILVAILDRNRQIVAANSLLIEKYGRGNLEEVLGTRPGEIVDCAHAWENPLGCGTARACRHCGAVAAILAARTGTAVTRECRIVPGRGFGALDLRVTACPFVFDGTDFILLAVEDIAHQKRREVLERVFFHDLANTAGLLMGASGLLNATRSWAEVRELAPQLQLLSDRLAEEIRTQRDLVFAERRKLEFETEEFSSRLFLEELVRSFQSTAEAAGVKLEIAEGIADCTLTTGRVLLLRILANMVNNALEASQPWDRVTVGCRPLAGKLCFWVNNPSQLPEAVAQQVFQRSFSTKGPGRGIGTYSMKILGEYYLKGTVSFTTDPDRGTTFAIHMPLPDGGSGDASPSSNSVQGFDHTRWNP